MRLDTFLKMIKNEPSGYILRKISNKITKSGKNLLEEYLYCYFSGTVTDELKCFLNYKTKIFNFNMRLFEKIVFGNTIKTECPAKGAKLLFYAIKSISHYGVKNPYLSINPTSVIWNITNKCNLNCVHCYQNSSNEEHELNFKEKLDVIDQLAESECVFLTFSGGEPLLSKNFFQVAEYAVKRGLIVRILTNGTLITKNVAEKISDLGVDLVSISLDGSTKKTHERIRGVPGSFDRAIEGIKNCVDNGITTATSPILIKSNYKELDDMIKLTKSLGAKYILINNFVPFGRGISISHFNLPPKVKNDVIKKLAKISMEDKEMSIVVEAPQFACAFKDLAILSGKKNMITDIGILKGFEMNINFLNTGCYAGRLTLVLDANGDIKPCILMDIVAGNTKKDRIKDVWNNSEVFKALRTREDLKGNCGKCKDKYICGGCRALAYAYFKDLNAPDPSCVRNNALWNKVKGSM